MTAVASVYERLVKIADIKQASQLGAGLGGAIPGLGPIGAAIGADEGSGWRSAGGALLGSAAGMALAPGHPLPMLVGGGLGAAIAHGPDAEARKRRRVHLAGRLAKIKAEEAALKHASVPESEARALRLEQLLRRV